MTNNEIKEIYKDLEHIEPETVRALRGPDTPSLQVLRDMAFKIIEETDAPFQDFYIFEDIVHVLNDINPDVEKIEGTFPEHIWYALKVMQEMLGENFGLSDEVKTYIRFIYKDHGLLFLPPIFPEEENPNLKKISERLKEGNLQESDKDPIENQAIQLARILYYSNTFKSKFE